MKYLSMYTPDPARAVNPPDENCNAQMQQLITEFQEKGILVATGGLLPVTQGGARMRRVAGEISVLDGPFAEAKEVVAGWAILEAKSREDVIEIARRFLDIAGDGECEVRPIMDPPQGV